MAAVSLGATACVGFLPRAEPLPLDYLEEGRATYVGTLSSTTRAGRGNTGEWDPGMTTAAHRTLPLGSCVLVTNLENGMDARVYVTDRGAYSPGIIIDLSYPAARRLGLLYSRNGVARVRLTPCG
jgi:rare lipoprotein A